MNILITGGAGFIGSHAVEHFSKEHDVYVVDNLRTGNKDNISGFPIVDFFKENIRYLTDYIDENRIDVVLNFAALTSVQESIEHPDVTEEINTEGIINLLSCCFENTVKLFIQASSAAVYGTNDCPCEEDMLRPKSPYAISKISGEHYARLFSNIYGFECLNLRFFNVFGPRQRSDGYAAVIPSFITKALAGEDLIIHGDGMQTRDFVYVKDLVKSIDILMQRALTNKTEWSTYNIGTGVGTRIGTLAKSIIRYTDSMSKITYDGEAPGDIKHSIADTTRLHQEGIRITADDFFYGLMETVDGYKKKILKIKNNMNNTLLTRLFGVLCHLK